MTIRFIPFFLFNCIVFSLAGQNLISNPSFELASDCPSGLGQIFFAQDWISSRESPDYYNSCANLSAPFSGVPANSFGYQYSASGNAYAGIICFNSGIFSREVITNNLLNPLSVGQKYYVTFKVNCADNSDVVGFNTNKIGAKFSTVLQANASIDNSPVLFTNSIISDTVNWSLISGAFIADSAYQFMMIGNFFDDENTSIEPINIDGWSYLYVDDVCLSTDSLFCSNMSNSIEEFSYQEMFSIYPNPTTEKIKIQNKSNVCYDYQIYNSIGELLESRENIVLNDIQVDLSTVNPGILFIKILTRRNQFGFKILKK